MASSSAPQVVALAQQANSIQIYIKTPATQSFPLAVETSDTVDCMKAKIQDKLSIPPELQRLYFAGTQLVDLQRLSEYGIQNESTIDLEVAETDEGSQSPGPSQKASQKASQSQKFERPLPDCGFCGSQTIMNGPDPWCDKCKCWPPC